MTKCSMDGLFCVYVHALVKNYCRECDIKQQKFPPLLPGEVKVSRLIPTLTIWWSRQGNLPTFPRADQ